VRVSKHEPPTPSRRALAAAYLIATRLFARPPQAEGGTDSGVIAQITPKRSYASWFMRTAL
jgi:hypothetical protein